MMITLRATRDPKKYEPLSPKKILALGKLNRRNENKTIICPMITIENSFIPSAKLI